MAEALAATEPLAANHGELATQVNPNPHPHPNPHPNPNPNPNP